MSAAGMPGGTARRNQPAGNDSGYAAQVRACIQRGVVYPTPPYSGHNPAVQYRVTLNAQGRPVSVSLRGSSGIAGFDRAVEAGIQSCNPFPQPQQGSYPAYIDGTYQMYDPGAATPR